MRQKTAGATLAGKRVTALTGLPRWVQAIVLVVVSTVVVAGALCQAGVVAPQFRSVGSGGGPPLPPMTGGEWTTLENLTLSTWQVNAVRLGDDDRERAFRVGVVLAPNTMPDPSDPPSERETAPSPQFDPLPLDVPPGGRLYVVALPDPTRCSGVDSPGAPPGAPPGPLQSDRVRVDVGITTPLGQRWIGPTVFVTPNCGV